MVVMEAAEVANKKIYLQMRCFNKDVISMIIKHLPISGVRALSQTNRTMNKYVASANDDLANIFSRYAIKRLRKPRLTFLAGAFLI
jgi:hypothetical protein